MTDRPALGTLDAVVVGSGPAGSIAAFVLARAGGRVALVDKDAFPRQKACGDLIGPIGIAVADELGVDLPGVRCPARLDVVGPRRGTVALPSPAGRTYGEEFLISPRDRFDDALRAAALDAGALAVTGRVTSVEDRGTSVEIGLDSGAVLGAGVVIGADGALSAVADLAGLIMPSEVLWGFAVRAYVDGDLDVPKIVFWERSPGVGFPGYGWVFPSSPGCVNVGLGIGAVMDDAARARTSRTHASAVASELPRFAEHLEHLGLIRSARSVGATRRLGGWLKLGMIGTAPARGRVLLVGDAAGLVNPLQGEGIAHAMRSGQLAATAVAASPGDAAGAYARALTAEHLPYQRVAAAAHQAILRRPRTVRWLTGAVSHVPSGGVLATAWSMFWGELLPGAEPGRAATIAKAITAAGRLASRRSSAAAWFRDVDGAAPPSRRGAPLDTAGSR